MSAENTAENDNVAKRRTPGPFDPNEIGPIAGDVVVEKGQSVYKGGTVSKRTRRKIYLKPPLDKGEVGSAWNGYDF